ncbi:hypothetical protein [Paraburkholderia hospita]|uniref:hypothetical protein n=1 Tax=Paraburkholderia hospita TaxID=169430 RepID=UPI0010542211|nr:hypothetical protein [Paraburkholderia hospita]
MTLDHVIARLAVRYGALPEPPVRQRKRRSSLDPYLAEMRTFTMRRLYARDPREFTLARLTRELREKTGRKFCEDTLRNYLVRHNLYQLWGDKHANP